MMRSKRFMARYFLRPYSECPVWLVRARKDQTFG